MAATTPNDATPTGGVAELEAELARTREGLRWVIATMSLSPTLPVELEGYIHEAYDAVLDGDWARVAEVLAAARAADDELNG